MPHDVRAEHRRADVHRRADDAWRVPERGDGRVQVALDVEPVLEEDIGRLHVRRGGRGREQRREERGRAQELGDRLGGHDDVVVRAVARVGDGGAHCGVRARVRECRACVLSRAKFNRAWVCARHAPLSGLHPAILPYFLLRNSAGRIGCGRRVGTRMHPGLGIVVVIAVVAVSIGPAEVGLGDDVVDAGVHKCIRAGHGGRVWTRAGWRVAEACQVMSR